MRQGQRAARKDRERQAERGQLRSGPAEVRNGDRDAGRHLDRLAVALSIEVADRQEIHAVERAREERRDKDQAEGRAERVGDHAAQPIAREGGRDRQHGLGAEPGGEHRGRAHVERETAARDQVVLRVVDPLRRPEPDADRDGEVGDDGGDQHARAIIAAASTPANALVRRAPAPTAPPAPAHPASARNAHRAIRAAARR